MNELTQRPNESSYEYHRRLVYGKLVDKTLADTDYSEIAEALYGQPYSPDVARRMLYGSNKTLQAIDGDRMAAIDNQYTLDEIDTKMIELRKERQKFFDQRAAFNKVVRERARQEELNEILEKAIVEGDLPSLEYRRTEIEPSDNDLLVSLNDIHYGADIDNYWNTYNPTVCRQMMRTYLDRIISVAEKHGSQNCIVWQNGDSISGNIHYSIAVSNKENVIEQVKGVSELIAEFLAALSEHFDKVMYVSVAGNHSRISIDKDFALTGERLDDLVEWYLGARLQHFDNVVIGAGEKIDNTMYLLNVRGRTYCGVHGDLDPSDSKIQSLQSLAQRPLYAVLCGHKHHCKIDDIQGVRTIMAGSFLGMDDYCVQKRIYGRPEQMICVCTEEGIECAYMVPLK